MSENEQRRAVGLRVREARTMAGLSQGQLAKLMDLHRPAISEIEAGNRNVKADELKHLSEILDVSTDFLTGAAPDVASLEDAKIQLAARELKKLSPEALDKFLKVLATLRSDLPPDDK